MNLIEVADKLLNEGLINKKERSQLQTDGNEVVDDSRFIVELAENGDVFVHNRGAYPLTLKGYAQ